MQDEVRYWFPTKRYGWGWGFPITWQGWTVFAVFIVLLIGGAVVLPARQSPVIFVVYVVVLGLALVGVCWWKGEPPRWRWGGK
ncbi:hypothetical protein Q3C01_02555 [Bradyrhizobium sp. UFLA05-109]